MVERERDLTVRFRGHVVGRFRADLIVEDGAPALRQFAQDSKPQHSLGSMMLF
ncbi:MAG: GxxExxY protein [Gemmatimonadota bacterium]|nr:GxxExxY protein [Gemmatimonadota bacterium]